MPANRGRVCPDGYEEALCLFCRQSAIFDHLRQCQEAGIKIPSRELESAMKQTRAAMEDLRIEKQNLGYEDGFEFASKPGYYDGFEIKDQHLSGNYKKLVAICEGMRNVDKVTNKNHFKYEQATLILTHYYVQTGQYPMRGALKFRLRGLLLKAARKRKEKTEAKASE